VITKSANHLIRRRAADPPVVVDELDVGDGLAELDVALEVVLLRDVVEVAPDLLRR